MPWISGSSPPLNTHNISVSTPAIQLVLRIYRIDMGERPAMRIAESFPLTRFDAHIDS